MIVDCSNVNATEYSDKFGRNLTYVYNDETGVLALSGTGIPYSDFRFPGEVGDAQKIVFENYSSTEIPLFEHFSNITEIKIPESVKKFQYYYQFAGCSKLEKVSLPEGLTAIPYAAFQDCTSLKSIQLPSTIKEIDWFAFEGCTSLTEFVVPEGVTELVEDVFRDCSSLEKVTLPNSLRKISCFVFYACTSLKEITIPDNVSEITWKNFQYCTSLEKIFIPEKTTKIDADNFDYADNVKIYGVEGSYAESFAKENFIEFVTTHKHEYIPTISKKPTCTTVGTETYTCLCGKSYIGSEPIPTTKHKKITTTIPATKSKNGNIVTKCKECGKVFSTKTIFRLGTVKLKTNECVYTGGTKSSTLIIKDSKGNSLKKGKDYTVKTPFGRKSIGKYIYTIQFIGNYKGIKAKNLTMTIKPKAPAISTPKGAKKAVTVKWKKGSKSRVTGYEVRVATNSKFTKNKKSVTVNKYSTTFKKMTKLKAKTKYYVQVRTYKTVKIKGKSTKIYSDWSKYKTVKVK